MNEQYVCPDADFKRWSINEDCGCQGGMISYHQVPRVGCDCNAINQEFDNLWDAIDEIEEEISGITPSSGVCDCEAIEAHFQTIGEDISTLSGKVITLENTMPLKADKATTYTKSEVDALISGITPSSGSCECDLTEVNDRLTALENVSGQCHCSFDDYYTKEQVDALIEAAISSGGSSSDRNFLYQTIDISGNVETVQCGDGLSGSTIYLKPIDYIGKNIVSFIVGKCATEIPNHCFSVISQTLKRLDLNGGNLITLGTNIISVSGSVKTIYVPSTVETIGDYAFEEAEKIIFQSPVPPSIGRSIGGDTQNGALIYVPKGSLELYEDVYNLYQYRDFNRIIEY